MLTLINSVYSQYHNLHSLEWIEVVTPSMFSNTIKVIFLIFAAYCYKTHQKNLMINKS
ncbi:hypothetical protein BC833DRAFT_586650 [Globomyces pollinis-pini]|nr:hypothetical protein BC833DRAFT_586650 [Globomyces pollinis-pini]